MYLSAAKDYNAFVDIYNTYILADLGKLESISIKHNNKLGIRWLCKEIVWENWSLLRSACSKIFNTICWI